MSGKVRHSSFEAVFLVRVTTVRVLTKVDASASVCLLGLLNSTMVTLLESDAVVLGFAANQDLDRLSRVCPGIASAQRNAFVDLQRDLLAACGGSSGNKATKKKKKANRPNTWNGHRKGAGANKTPWVILGPNDGNFVEREKQPPAGCDEPAARAAAAGMVPPAAVPAAAAVTSSAVVVTDDAFTAALPTAAAPAAASPIDVEAAAAAAVLAVTLLKPSEVTTEATAGPSERAAAEITAIRGIAGMSFSKLVRATLGLPLKKDEQISNWDRRPLLAQQLEYAALDAEALVRVWVALPEPLRDTMLATSRAHVGE